jgi:ribonuclease T2
MTLPRPSVLALGLALLALVLPALTRAVALVDGSFLAIKDCPAWDSKLEQTNPGTVFLAPGKVYPVAEVDFPEAPTAYRLRIEAANPKYRWVSADCGEYPPKSDPAEIIAKYIESKAVKVELNCPAPPPKPDACRTCGPSDSFVLALNWQPGLCQADAKKSVDRPECSAADPGAFHARNFTFRELRPVRAKCKKQVGFCGAVDREPKQLADYPPVELSEQARQDLLRIMPLAASDSGLERQAWHRYGTCTGLPEEAYFKAAGDLVQQFNGSGLAEFMAAHLNQRIKREDFFKEVERIFGADARKRITLDCSADAKVLTGVNVSLAGEAGPGADLRRLLKKGPRAWVAGNCGSRIVIAAVGQDSPPTDAAPADDAEAKAAKKRARDKQKAKEKKAKAAKPKSKSNGAKSRGDDSNDTAPVIF